MSFFRKSGIVNVKMVITEEKILSNIDKIQKLIKPSSKKQIVELEEDSYFKELVESVKSYLVEYPKKKNFPANVYKATYDLVEYATNQFEENTKQIEELIRKREKNIKLANVLSDVLKVVKAKSKNSKEIIKKVKKKYPEDVVEALKIINESENKDEEYQAAEKLIKAKINNLEANMFVEIDIERIEDRSKALSYIGIEIAEALNYIPAPVPLNEMTDTNQFEEAEENEETEEKSTSELLQEVLEGNVGEEISAGEQVDFYEGSRFEAKPSLWQKIKNSKLVRGIKYITKIRIRVELPALPEGRGE